MERRSVIGAAVLWSAMALAKTLSGSAPVPVSASVPLPPVPFAFDLAVEDRSGFDDPDRFDGSGVEARITWTTAGADRVDVFQERSGTGWPKWKWMDARTIQTGAAAAVLAAAPGVRTLVIWRRAGDGNGRYAAASIFSWPRETRDVALDPILVRTLRGEGSPSGSIRLLRFASASFDGDAVCETDGAEKWQCIAVPRLVGAVVSCPEHGDPRSAAIDASLAGEVRLEPASWLALVAVDENGDEAQREERGRPEEPASFAISFATGSRGQIRTSERARANRLGRNLYLVRGPLGPPGPSTRLVVRSAGRVGTIGADELLSASCERPIRVPLLEVRTVRGRVRGPAGAPLAHASVLLLEPGEPAPDRDEKPPPVLSASTQTDDNGIFAFSEAENGKWRVRACHASAGCAERDAPADASEIEIVLAPRWRFTGRLVSAAGVPQGQAHLRFLPTLEHYEQARDRLLTLPPESDAESDAEGRFEIAPVSVGSYFLEARAAHIGSARRRVDITELTPGRTDLGDVVLSGAGEFLVRVTQGCPGGSLALAGPVGATSLPAIRDFPIDASGIVPVDLPEGGDWLVWGRCADGRRDADPAMLANVESLYGGEVALKLVVPGTDPEPAGKHR